MGIFEQDLYDAVCVAIPGTTVRSLSRLLGRSSGYWSSITAQGLVVSTAALIHLHDSLETKLLVADTSSYGYMYLQRVQDLVRAQLMERFALVVNFSAKKTCQTADVKDYGVLPISVLIY